MSRVRLESVCIYHNSNHVTLLHIKTASFQSVFSFYRTNSPPQIVIAHPSSARLCLTSQCTYYAEDMQHYYQPTMGHPITIANRIMGICCPSSKKRYAIINGAKDHAQICSTP